MAATKDTIDSPAGLPQREHKEPRLETVSPSLTTDSASSKLTTQSFDQYIAQAKSLTSQERWDAAILQYREALRVRPNAPAWVYLAVGPLLIRMDRVDEAMNCYRKANALNSKNALPYALMGVALEKKKLFSDAIASYSKALTLKSTQPYWLHVRLATLLAERAQLDYERSAISYLQAMCLQDSFTHFLMLNKTLEKVYGSTELPLERSKHRLVSKLGEEKHFAFATKLASLGFLNGENRSSVNPAGYYVVNEKLKVIYCSIPKNACTLFKTMMIEIGSIKDEFDASNCNVHEFLSRKSKNTSASLLMQCLKSDDYFKFAILRNPFNRLVSGYIDKFAKHVVPEKFVQDIILEVQTSLNVPLSIEKSITFSQFVDYLERTPDFRLNDHWQPQSHFIAGVPFDLIGQFESLDKVIGLIEKKFSITIRKKVSSHITAYKKFNEKELFHDAYPEQLRSLEAMPAPAHFYPSPLAQKVTAKYKQDVETYSRLFSSISI